MKLGLSDTFRLVKLLDEKRATSSVDHKKIDLEISNADKGLEKRLASFQINAGEALKLFEKGKVDDVFYEKIMYLRINAIQISEAFEDVIDALDKVSLDEKHSS